MFISVSLFTTSRNYVAEPMGAQGKERADIFRQRYEDWEDNDVKKFHYGSHYSSAGVVLHYLIRLQPFTDQNKVLQGGNFDVPDRLFHSIGEAWKSAAYESMTDVRELIPEFFYLPEFLCNNDNIALGTRQDGSRVHDVILPPWAKVIY